MISQFMTALKNIPLYIFANIIGYSETSSNI